MEPLSSDQKVPPPLRVKADRLNLDPREPDWTGILVRAQAPDGSWMNADIGQLDRESLHRWLRSRGGRNLWAENVVLMILGHEQYDVEPT